MVEAVKKIDENEELYREMISRPKVTKEAEKIINSWEKNQESLKTQFYNDANTVLHLVIQHRNTIAMAKDKCEDRKTPKTPKPLKTNCIDP